MSYVRPSCQETLTEQDSSCCWGQKCSISNLSNIVPFMPTRPIRGLEL